MWMCTGRRDGHGCKGTACVCALVWVIVHRRGVWGVWVWWGADGGSEMVHCCYVRCALSVLCICVSVHFCPRTCIPRVSSIWRRNATFSCFAARAPSSTALMRHGPRARLSWVLWSTVVLAVRVRGCSRAVELSARPRRSILGAVLRSQGRSRGSSHRAPLTRQLYEEAW